jgi:hypothetical protein
LALESRPFLVEAAPFLCAIASVLALAHLVSMLVTLTWVYF